MKVKLTYERNLSKKKKKTVLEGKSNLKSSFPQPKKVECFDCKAEVIVKFVIPRLSYSQKNDWGYWTEKEEDKGKYKCNSCLRQIYSNKEIYWQAVKSSEKRSLFRSYLYDKHI